MGLVHPGLGERLEGLVGDVRALEAGAGDQPSAVAALKAVIGWSVLMVVSLLSRDDGTNALDWEESDRTADEEWGKRRVVTGLSQLLRLMRQAPVRTWPEVTELEDALGALQAGEDAGWEPEIVRLGEQSGITVERVRTSGGMAAFQTAGGSVGATVYKALTPEVVLEGVDVYLVQRIGDDSNLLDEYAVMVDDPYWGRKIAPGAFAAAPLDEILVMGWRVKGRVLQDGVPVEGAKVSLEGLCEAEGIGAATFWDSLEYNELIWSDTLETYVEGALVYAPIMTGTDGRWEFICPGGYGAIYQREPSPPAPLPETADGLRGEVSTTSPRRLVKLSAVYRGRKVELSEEAEAVIDVLSGKLVVSGEPGCWVRVATLDEAGEVYLIQEDGTAVAEGLPSGEHNVVQYRLSGWGEWDSGWGCARQVAAVEEGATATVSMGMMETLPPGKIGGRVYERPGVPAAGLDILPINFESQQIGEAIATTDGGGYWEATVLEEGFGGDPWIMDAKWGAVPLLGYPYSDVVLGARAYAAWQEMWKPEAWRKGDHGHSNFQYVQDALWAEDEEGERYATEEVAYGGWITSEALPKYRPMADVNELMMGGPQIRRYSLRTEGRVLDPEFYLRAQSFEDYETLPGQYRAAGYYPEAKFLLGGKIKGSVVEQNEAPIGLELAEAHRIGLEFGEHVWYTQVAAGEVTAFGDLVCPYCGGPTWRDPSGQGFVRGFCMQCALVFGTGEAMDGRTHFATPAMRPSPPAPLPGGEGSTTTGYGLWTLMVDRRGGSRSCEFGFHWRTDLYDETEAFLTQSGAGQATNAPRWFARHVDEVDGLGFGRFDSAASPPFCAGHDLGWFGQLPEVQRELGLAQMKLVYPYGYAQAEAVTLELDCRRADGSTETVRVEVPAGVSGPNEGKALSEATPLVTTDKVAAEDLESPYAGSGFFTAVTAARVVEGGECQFTIVNDTPLLARAGGVVVVEGRAALVALQTGERSTPSGPHLMDDGVGQVFVFYARDGQIQMRRRKGLVSGWEPAKQLTQEGRNLHPCAEKDGRGRLRLAWQRGGDMAQLMSLDDGEQWVEV